jgi:tyrosinase
MSDIMYSPCDPIFWLHHAFIDRVWTQWQVPNPGQAPPLSGADRVMDPWAETLDDAVDAAGLGYAYD